MERRSSDAPAPHGGDALPEELAAWIAAAPAVLDATRDAHHWDAATRQRTLLALDRVANAITVGRSRVVTAEAEAGTWGLKGDRDLPRFLGRVTRQGPGSGFAQVGQAATLTAMPAVADAMVDGSVTPKHLQEITRAMAASPLLASELVTAEGQERLVEMAGRLDGRAFGTRLRQMSAELDPASRQRSHDEQRAKRFLTLTHRSDGTELRGFLDSVTGYTVRKMLDAFTPRPAKDDTRPRDVRQADALAALADHVLSDKRTTPGTTAPVQAVVTVSQETWAALRATRSEDRDGAGRDGRVPSDGSMADVVGRLRGVPAAVDETGQAWPATEIARALCDCLLTRAVVNAEGQVLDLGTEDRLFTRGHWLALIASGQTTCAVEGCGMPLRYSQLHHMAWWLRDDGPTSLANCAPECTFHHGEIHRLDLRVTRRADGSYEHRYPDGRLYGGVPPDDGPPTGGSSTGEPPTGEPPAAASPTGGSPGDDPPGQLPLYDAA